MSEEDPTLHIFTQNDFIVATMLYSLKTDVFDGEISAFLAFIKDSHTDREKYQLIALAEKQLEDRIQIPSRERLRELSEIYFDLPRDNWELLEMQTSCN